MEPAVAPAISPRSAFDGNPRFAGQKKPQDRASLPGWLKDTPAMTPAQATPPQIDAPIVPSAAVSPPTPDAGFMARVNAAIPSAEKRYGFNMKTGAIAPPPATGNSGPAGPQGAPMQGAKIAAGMQSIADYNRRMAPKPAATVPATPFGVGMNGEDPMLSKPFGTGMNGEDPIVARMPRRSKTQMAPNPEPAGSPYENRMASMLQGDTAGLDQPQPAQSALMTDPPMQTPQQDPFFAKLEGSLRGAKVVPAGRRGARRGATIKGGQFSGQLLSDVMDRQRRLATP